jgi:hypothetical protein
MEIIEWTSFLFLYVGSLVVSFIIGLRCPAKGGKADEIRSLIFVQPKLSMPDCSVSDAYMYIKLDYRTLDKECTSGIFSPSSQIVGSIV